MVVYATDAEMFEAMPGVWGTSVYRCVRCSSTRTFPHNHDCEAVLAKAAAAREKEAAKAAAAREKEAAKAAKRKQGYDFLDKHVGAKHDAKKQRVEQRPPRLPQPAPAPPSSLPVAAPAAEPEAASPAAPRSRDEEHFAARKRQLDVADLERRRRRGELGYRGQHNLGTGLFAAAATGAAGEDEVSEVVELPQPPQPLQRVPPTRKGAASASVLSGTGFAWRADGMAVLNGYHIYGRCAPACELLHARFPPRTLLVGETRPTAIFATERTDGGLTWREASSQGDDWFGEVPVATGGVSASLSVAPNGGVKLDVRPERRLLRTHFKVRPSGALAPAHEIGGTEKRLLRGMGPNEAADGSVAYGNKGIRHDFVAMHQQYPARALIKAAEDGASEKAVWLQLFRDERDGMKPLDLDTLPFLVSGSTPSQRKARAGALRAARSQKQHAAAIDLDREGKSQPLTYDVAGWVQAGEESEESGPVAGSARNEDKSPVTEEQLQNFYANLAADARRLTGGTVRTWGDDMHKHAIANGGAELDVVDALAALRSFLPTAKPSKHFSLAADFLVPIFYPGEKYKHKALSDARMIGGIVTGFFDALIEYFNLSDADLNEAEELFT